MFSQKLIQHSTDPSEDVQLQVANSKFNCPKAQKAKSMWISLNHQLKNWISHAEWAKNSIHA